MFYTQLRMESHTSEHPISPPDKSKPNLPNLDRTFLAYQTIFELKQAAPLRDIPDSDIDCVEGEKFSNIIRNLRTHGGDHPYSHADIKVEQLSNISDVQFTQTYVNPKRINDLIYLAMDLNSRGIDLFNLNGLVADSKGFKISPPILEVDAENNYKVVMGHHRLLTAYFLGTPINIVTVRNYDSKHSRPYLPVPLNAINLTENIPHISERRTLIPGRSEKDFIDFSSLGESGKRRSPEELDKDYLHYFPAELTNPQDIALYKEIQRVMKRFKLLNFLPNCVAPDATNQSIDIPRFRELIGVSEISHQLGLSMPEINIYYGQNRNQDVIGIFRPIVETKKRHRSISSNMGTLVRDNSELNQFLEDTNQFRPQGEVKFSDEIFTKLNQVLESKGFRQFEKPDSPLVGKDIPDVVEFRLIEDNQKYFNIVVLKLSSGQEQVFILNRPHPNNHGEKTDGSVFVVRNSSDQYLLNNRYRELTGAYHIESPRCFGFSLSRIKNETGLDLSSSIDQAEKIDLPEDQTYKFSHDSVFLISQTGAFKLESPQQDFIDNAKEVSQPLILSGQDIHQLIVDGNLPCDITTASITIDQLNRGTLIQNPDINSDDIKLLLERVYSVAEGKYNLVFPKGKSNLGQRIGKNSFPDTGISIIYRHLESVTLDSLPKDRTYSALSIETVINLMKSGSLDMSTVANISRLLRSQGILIYKTN